MTNTSENRKALKAALKNTPHKVKVTVPAPGTFCQVAFCSDEAKIYLEDRAICNIHHKAFIELEVN